MSNYSDSQFNYSDDNSSWMMTLNRIPEKSEVLDIGCSVGLFGEELIKRKNCIVDGIEINSDDAKIARKKLRQVWVLDIERDSLPNKKYDIIFMGDVVEHLSTPAPTLRKLLGLLKENGALVFSIPNITHMSVRLMLLRGNIEYGKTGLLDETHLHFYNQAEIYRVFNEAGYKIENISYVERDVPISFLKTELEEIGLQPMESFTKLAQSVDAAAYQFVGVARRSNSSVHQELPAKSPININDEHIKSVYERHNASVSELKVKLQHLDNENKRLNTEYTKVSESNSYKIGRKITLPIRAAKYGKHRLAKQYVMQKNITRIKRVIAECYGMLLARPVDTPKISLVIRSIEHPTSSTFIRLISPLATIARVNQRMLELVDGDKPRISRSTKAVVVQRTAIIDKATAQNLIEKIQARGIKLFVDTDDAFGDIDKNHPQYDLHKERIDALNLVIENADEVWFSTDPLKKSYKTKNSVVIRNTLDPQIWGKLKKSEISIPKKDDPLQILYMGTKTHDGDFGVVLPVFQKLHEKYPGQFTLHLIGVAAKTDTEPWLKLHSPPDGLYPKFVQWFSTIGAFDVGISPLEDSAFNSNKSDIKCLDYMAIGVKPIVSDVVAYKNKELNEHIFRVRNTESAWFSTLEKEIIEKNTNRENSKVRIKNAYDYIESKRLSETAGDQIKERLRRYKVDI